MFKEKDWVCHYLDMFNTFRLQKSVTYSSSCPDSWTSFLLVCSTRSINRTERRSLVRELKLCLFTLGSLSHNDLVPPSGVQTSSHGFSILDILRVSTLYTNPKGQRTRGPVLMCFGLSLVDDSRLLTSLQRLQYLSTLCNLQVESVSSME